MIRSIAYLTAGFATTTLAQPVGAPVESQRPQLKLEEIVVTADRRASFSADLVQAGSFRGARQLDTAITVAVLPRTLLDAQQASNLLDALRNPPASPVCWSARQFTTTCRSAASRSTDAGTTG